MAEPRSRYSIRRFAADLIVLVDHFDPTVPARSVTNDADQVILELQRAGTVGNRRVLYAPNG